MAVQLGRPVLVEFMDVARINSVRTLPYTVAWNERYGPLGLRVIGVHSPGYSFGRDPEVVVPAIEKLGIPYPVVLDPDFVVWREYGNRGWPARYLFDRRGLLRVVHWGEGEYDETEAAIQELLLEADAEVELPPPLEPLRAEDRPGAEMEPQTADIALPAERDRVELTGTWIEGEDFIEAREAEATASTDYRAGEAYAVLSGTTEPGLYPTQGTVTARSAGLRLHGFQFTPIPPPTSE